MTGFGGQARAGVGGRSPSRRDSKVHPRYVPALMVKAVIAEQKPDPAVAEQTYESSETLPRFHSRPKILAILYARNPTNDAKAYPLAVKARDAFPAEPGCCQGWASSFFGRGIIHGP